MNLTKPLAIVCGILLMLSCSPESKLRRANKLIKQAEAEGLQWKTDTVYRDVTVTIPEIKLDTVIKVMNWRDTITVTKDRVTTRVVVTPQEKTVYIESECDSVTIVKEVPVTVTKRIEVPVTKEKKAMFIFLGILTGMGITFLLIWLIQRFVKRK